ncbi:MAG: hypothetical protein QOD68_2046, partial [Actinomycetota bacterium]|nr:hypothetical protein [Actinomycetota bacterium]
MHSASTSAVSYAARMSRRPRVALLATGGTIACTLDRHGH